MLEWLYAQHWSLWLLVLILILLLMSYYLKVPQTNFSTTSIPFDLSKKRDLTGRQSNKNEPEERDLDEESEVRPPERRKMAENEDEGRTTEKDRSLVDEESTENVPHHIPLSSITEDRPSIVTSPESLTIGSRNTRSRSRLIPLPRSLPQPVSEEVSPPADPPAQPTFKTKRPGSSRKEELCRRIIEEIYQKPFIKVRPDFLKNPETGINLELDCYNDELKIALEYNGIQHYEYPNYTGQTYEEFVAQVRRDMFKAQRCEEEGIYLITVPYRIPEHMLRAYIEYYTPEKVAERRQLNEEDDAIMEKYRTIGQQCQPEELLEESEE